MPEILSAKHVNVFPKNFDNLLVVAEIWSQRIASLQRVVSNESSEEGPSDLSIPKSQGQFLIISAA